MMTRAESEWWTSPPEVHQREHKKAVVKRRGPVPMFSESFRWEEDPNDAEHDFDAHPVCVDPDSIPVRDKSLRDIECPAGSIRRPVLGREKTERTSRNKDAWKSNYSHPKSTGTRPEDLDRIRSLYDRGKTCEEIGQILHRNKVTIWQKLNRLGYEHIRVNIPKTPGRRTDSWTVEEDRHLLKLVYEKKNRAQIAEELNRTVNAVTTRLGMMRKTMYVPRVKGERKGNGRKSNHEPG